MKGTLDSPIQYHLRLGEHEIHLNPLLGKPIRLSFTGQMHCIQCGRKINKTFQQGYCFPCLRRLQECDLCVIYPERCHVEEGTCPQDDWAHAQCYQEHIIYLANTSGLKVGITRHTQVPTRWIDQGARQALPIFQAANRYQSGLIEVALKQYVSDRTNWRVMLKQEANLIDLYKERDRLLAQAHNEIESVISGFKPGDICPIDPSEIVELSYPITQYPEKITSLSFDKTPDISGVLLGIKGQYLILDAGVINIRKFGGYEVSFLAR